MQLRINRYLRLVASHFREAQCISVSGPDGTKVGTDLHINMSGMLNTDPGRAATGARCTSFEGMTAQKEQGQRPATVGR